MNAPSLLTTLTLLPAAGGVITLVFGRERTSRERTSRALAMLFALASLAMACLLGARFDAHLGGLQFVTRHPWIPALGVEYHLGVDGLGLTMVLLSTLLVPMAIAASGRTTARAPLYFSLMLFLESGLIGTFTALNFIHWFLYWELGLIPAFFLIRLWGGPGRARASTQFFVYTMAGSVTMLLSFLALYGITGSFDFTELANRARSGNLALLLGTHGQSFGMLLFAGVFFGLAVKVPILPFHTWLPDAYAEAPSAVTMLLAGGMSKMGVYGFLRLLLPIFGTEAQVVRTPLLWLAVATIVVSAFAAFAQRDIKRIFAYSSMNHLGFCMLAIFSAIGIGGADIEQSAIAIEGAVLQMFNHGITAAALFWFVALLEQRSGGLRGIDDFGGLRKPAPILCGLMGIAIFSSLGLPGLNGFIGEFLILKGSFPLAAAAVSTTMIGLLLTAVFLLTLLQRVFSGPVKPVWERFPDLTIAERVTLGPIIALMFVLGIYPQLLLSVINGTALTLAHMFGR